jgi:hypothetical protein
MFAAALSCVAGLCVTTQAGAQAFPNKPVQVVIPFAPGDNKAACYLQEPRMRIIVCVETNQRCAVMMHCYDAWLF